MIKVRNSIKVYEIGGAEVKEDESIREIRVHSHWNRNEMIDIELPGFPKLTVSAKDLKAAIENATNSARY